MRFAMLCVTLGLALGACQTKAPLETFQAPRFDGAIEPITTPLTVHPKPFPPSPSRLERTITARDQATGEIANLSGTIFSTVTGDRSGSNVAVTTTIDRFDGYHANQPSQYEPGTKIRFVYGAAAQPRNMSIRGPAGEIIKDTERAKLLQITFRQGIDVPRIVTGTRVLIAEFGFPGMADQTVRTDGLVKGKAMFKNRPVAVVDYHGTVSGGPATTEMGGYFLVDLDTWMVVYTEWRTLTPIRQGKGHAHIREVAELSLRQK